MTPNNAITSFDVSFYAGNGYTFACVNFHRTTSSRGRYPSPASLLRATRMQRKIARVTAAQKPYSYGGPHTVKPAPAPLCDFDDCDQLALAGHDFCATHQAEHDENMAACEQVEPESNIEAHQLDSEGVTLAERLERR